MKVMFLILCTLFCKDIEPPKMLVHNIHLSKSEVRYLPAENSIQLSLHLFIDDLEESIKNTTGENLKLFESQESLLSDSLIANYIKSKFIISTDNKRLDLTFIGKESSEDLMAVWCYFEIFEVFDFSNIKIDNLILHELFDDQKNIVSYYLNKENKKFKILNKNDYSLTVRS